MKLLFIHQNFPGQFKFLAPALAAQGHTVLAMTMQKVKVAEWQGVKLVPYAVNRGTTPAVHPWVSDFETKTIRGEACFRAALQLKAQGFAPDVIIAHPGWGESLFLKDVWPQAKLGIYCEFYYRPEGADVGFDPGAVPGTVYETIFGTQHKRTQRLKGSDPNGTSLSNCSMISAPVRKLFHFVSR